jgi:translation initiation factor 2B subunit (eIF-2B alpha/beta/delta family)
MYKNLPYINKKIIELENDYLNGSTVIGKKALDILFFALNNEEIANSDKQINLIAKKIISAKPTMSAVKNLIEFAVHTYYENKNKLKPNEIFYIINKKFTIAKQKTLTEGLKIISKINHENIITCSFSSTVLNLIQELKKHSENLNIFALKSLWKKKNYADSVISECRKLNIRSTQLNAEDISDNNISCGIIGADSIIINQGIINGIPSLSLAKILFDLKIPLYAIGESFKTSNIIQINDGFEFIPLNLISEVIYDKEFI